MKQFVDTIDATPSKRLFLSIIADYDLTAAVAELVDNALDIWTLSKRVGSVRIAVTLDVSQQRIVIQDNAGGIARDNLHRIVAPGSTGNDPQTEVIGLFGVGTKRAVIALAQSVRIKTCRETSTFLVEFDDEWLKEEDNWILPVYESSRIDTGTTVIELTKLRKPIDENSCNRLVRELGTLYSAFILTGKVEISINGVVAQAQTFENWAYPPGYEPRQYSGSISTTSGDSVGVIVTAGLALESSPASGEYGVYIYCNNRLVARGAKTIEVGFGTGLAGKPHADISLARVIVHLHGPAHLMPWSSNKSSINTSHEVFLALQKWLQAVVKDYSSLSRRLSRLDGAWKENVFAYPSGELKEVVIENFPTAETSYLPPLPTIQPRYGTVVTQKNRSIGEKKPWVVGIYESMVVVDWIGKQAFRKGNRIMLILLDSTLEIAFKEYLAHDCPVKFSASRLSTLFGNRKDVHSEIRKHLALTDDVWGQIEYFYLLRCSLIHQKASAEVPDSDIRAFRSIVQEVLAKLFKLKL